MANKSNFKKEILYIAILLLAITINDQFLIPLPSQNSLFNYNISQWGLSYDSGFIRRGFVGFVINLLHLVFTDYFIYYSLTAVAAILLGALLILIRLYKLKPDLYTFMFILFIVSVPSNIRWWKSYSMFASMDMFIFINAVIIILLNIKLKISATSLISSVVLSVASVLINEQFIFIYFPLVVCIMLYKSTQITGRIELKSALLYAAPVIVAAIFVWIAGNAEIEAEQLNHSIRKHLITSFGISTSYNLAYENLYYMNLPQKLQNAFSGITPKDLLKLLSTALLLSPSICVYIGLLKKGFSGVEGAVKRRLIFASCIAMLFPLVGFFVLNFYYMWLGYIFITATIFIISMFFIDGGFKDSALEYIKSKYILLGAVGLYNICLGAIGATSSFEWIEALFRQIS